MENLTVVYFSLLNNMWDIENQLALELPKVATNSTHEELRTVLYDHAKETQNHKIRLEELLQHHNVPLSYERDLAFETLLQNASASVALITDQNVKDAFILASAQTIEHIEISRYTTLHQWAKQLDDTLGYELLYKTLIEEESALSKLSALGEGTIFTLGLNEKAAESGL